jgi:hypothetical protein
MDAVANPSVATRTLSLTNVTMAQDGSYSVVVTNSCRFRSPPATSPP